MNLDVVIPIGLRSLYGNIELRYALRSIQKHLRSYRRIVIVGEKPDWLTGVIHIPYSESAHNYHKEKNIFDKIVAASTIRELSDPFYFTNDDHFLLQDFAASEFPYHYDGMLAGLSHRIDLYGNTIHNTLQLIGNYQYFDTHCPIIYSKAGIKKVQEAANWDKKWGYCIKTAYCSLNGVKGTEYPDLKINQPMTYDEIKEAINGRPYFSTGEKGRSSALTQVMQELYPKKSKYEI